MAEDIRTHYEAVLRDLDGRAADVQTQLAVLQRRLRELQTTKQNILRLLAPAEPFLAYSRPAGERKYSDLSVRWAILCLLSESGETMSIPDIAEALQNGGVHTKATNFNNNVSAVLSQMKAKDIPEVEVEDGKWRITENGRNAWSHISMKQARAARRGA